MIEEVEKAKDITPLFQLRENAKLVFQSLTSREYYRTEGFSELALQLSSTLS